MGMDSLVRILSAQGVISLEKLVNKAISEELQKGWNLAEVHYGQSSGSTMEPHSNAMSMEISYSCCLWFTMEIDA